MQLLLKVCESAMIEQRHHYTINWTSRSATSRLQGLIAQPCRLSFSQLSCAWPKCELDSSQHRRISFYFIAYSVVTVLRKQLQGSYKKFIFSGNIRFKGPSSQKSGFQKMYVCQHVCMYVCESLCPLAFKLMYLL